MHTNIVIFLLSSLLSTNNSTNLVASAPLRELEISRSTPVANPSHQFLRVKMEVFSNTVVNVVWKGKTNVFVLESVKIAETEKHQIQ